MNPALFIGAFFAIAFPLGMLIWWKKKTGVKLWCFIAGIIIFPVFAMGLETILHQICIYGSNPISTAITGTPLLYMLYASLAAGIFEETGRLVGFKNLLKNHNEKESAIAYGIGHGGIEVFLVLGMTYFVYLLVNMGVYFSDYNTTLQILYASNSVTIGGVLTAVLERVSAVMLHIGLSIIVFIAVKQKGKISYYPAAILIHAVADAPAALYQLQIIKSIWLIEGFALFMGIATLYIAIGLYKEYKNEDEEQLDLVEETEAKEVKSEDQLIESEEQAVELEEQISESEIVTETEEQTVETEEQVTEEKNADE